MLLLLRVDIELNFGLLYKEETNYTGIFEEVLKDDYC